MKFEDYDNFYQHVILGYINELRDFDSKCHALTFNSKAYKSIYHYYEKKRIEIRNVYMSDASKPIDRHKTAASMMYAILKANVFKVNKSIPCLPEPLRLANEYLAFYVAMNIIEQYKRTDEINGEKISKNYQLIIPKTSYESQTNQMTGEVDNSFISSICLTLANIKNLKYFDVFSYATIMFLLEKNTDNIIYRDEEIHKLEKLKNKRQE